MQQGLGTIRGKPGLQAIHPSNPAAASEAITQTHTHTPPTFYFSLSATNLLHSGTVPVPYMEIPVTLPAQHTTEMHPQIPNTLAPAAVRALFPLFDCLPVLLPVREARILTHSCCCPAAGQPVAAAAVAAAAEGVWGRERGGMHAQVNRHSHSLLFEGGLQMKV